jgi:hypothetical protein
VVEKNHVLVDLGNISAGVGVVELHDGCGLVFLDDLQDRFSSRNTWSTGFGYTLEIFCSVPSTMRFMAISLP